MIPAKRFSESPAKESASKILVRFGVALTAFVSALVLLSRDSGAIGALAPLDVLTAEVTAVFLRLSGMPVHQEAAVLSHPSGFSCEIYYKCTGLILALFLSAALLALRDRWASKVMNIFFGAVLVFALNFVRLVSLFYIGVRYPQVFGFFHSIFWEAAMLVFVLGFWLRAAHRSGARVPPQYC